MKNPNSTNPPTLPELILKYAHTFHHLNEELIFEKNHAHRFNKSNTELICPEKYNPFHEQEVDSIIKAVGNLSTMLEHGAYALTSLPLIQQYFKIDFDLATLTILKKMFSNYNFEFGQSNETFPLLYLMIGEYLRTRKDEQEMIDRRMRSLLETIDAFSKECSGEVKKLISSITKNDRGQNTECMPEDHRRISYAPFTLQPMTQAQRDEVFFGVAGGAGVVLASGLFRRASASVGPAIRNTLRNFFRR